MSLESLAPVRAWAGRRQLSQHLIDCPGCGKAAAVHLDTHGGSGTPTLVRVVCPEACVVAEDAVRQQLAMGELIRSA